MTSTTPSSESQTIGEFIREIPDIPMSSIESGLFSVVVMLVAFLAAQALTGVAVWFYWLRPRAKGDPFSSRFFNK